MYIMVRPDAFKEAIILKRRSISVSLRAEVGLSRIYKLASMLQALVISTHCCSPMRSLRLSIGRDELQFLLER